MSYSLILTVAAEAQLRALPEPLGGFVREQIQRLRQSPSALSRPASVLHARGQLFEFHYDRGGVSVWVSVIFRYGQDEQTLHVEDIVTEFG